MRYIADTEGYVKQVSFGADIVCADQECSEYTGSAPSGYKDLEDWFFSEMEKLYRWRIVDGQLTLDSAAVAPVEGDDSGWVLAALEPAFTAYEEGFEPKFRKIGKLVELQGAIRCTAAIGGSTTLHPIFTLPEGYRPSIDRVFLCQGSSRSSWMLQVDGAGVVSFSRYRDERGYLTTSTSTWLPFSAMFFADEDGAIIPPPTPMTATHDGAGNVTVYGVTATHDGAGNVTIL